ncbi:MAG: hypothetical protein ACRD0P_02050 [Stackebrandtia sp.]
MTYQPPAFPPPGTPGIVPGPPPKKSRAVWIVGAVLVLVLAGGLITIFMLAGNRSGDKPGDTAGGDEKSASPSPAVVAETPVEAVEGYFAAIHDHDAELARAYVCRKPESGKLDVPTSKDDEYWDEVDDSDFYVHEREVEVDDDWTAVRVTKTLNDEDFFIMVDVIKEDGTWRLCDWYDG